MLMLVFLGKYVGNRPVKLKKADNNINPVEIGHRKAKQLEKERARKQDAPLLYSERLSYIIRLDVRETTTRICSCRLFTNLLSVLR